MSIGTLAYWELTKAAPYAEGAPTHTRTLEAAQSAAAARSPGKGAPAALPARLSVELLPSGELRFTRAGWCDVHAVVTSYVLSGEQTSFRLELMPATDETAATAVPHSTRASHRSELPVAFCTKENGMCLSLNYTTLALLKK